MSFRFLLVLISALLCALAAHAADPLCFTGQHMGVDCSKASGRAADSCFLLCGLCTTPELAFALSADDYKQYCLSGAFAFNQTQVGQFAASLIYNAGAVHGYFWLDDQGDLEQNATVALAHLLTYMPRRDAMAMFSAPLVWVDFLAETVRMALHTWPRLDQLGVPWSVFLDGVLPYAVLDEKRDVEWRWRPRLAQLLASAWDGATTIYEAMVNLTSLIPEAAPDHVLALVPSNGAAGFPRLTAIPGRPFTWRSSSSPAYLSTQQVAAFGGSCTGTGIVLVAAARAIGIPARLEGCSESVVRGDDHHWVGFYDPSSPGPLGDYWHTKEGVSAGNPGGPWDSPSGPMLGCLQGVVPGSALDNLWAGVWSGDAYLPTLWAPPQLGQTWAWIGGVNRCGVYCTAWGCGQDNKQHWSQTQCQPTKLVSSTGK